MLVLFAKDYTRMHSQQNKVERMLFEWERLGERSRRQQEKESCDVASWRPCASEWVIRN